MRVEISEVVDTPNRETVLRALETCSREVSSKVERYGDRIILQGLGPSPRAKNVRDTTIFFVNAEKDRTIISGEANFQASALLGDQPQADVVRSKLEELFHQMKAQIDLDSRRAARASELPHAATRYSSAVGSSDGRFDVGATQPGSTNPAFEVDSHSISAAQLATGAEHEGEQQMKGMTERADLAEQPERNVWLDELFTQMKAELELDETPAAHATTGSAAEVLPAAGRLRDHVAENDSFPEEVTVSSEDATNTALPSDASLVVGSELAAKPEKTLAIEQSSGVEPSVEGKQRVGPRETFDLKENVWLEELFHKVNAQIDLDEKLEAQAVGAAIEIPLPPEVEAVAPVQSEDIPESESATSISSVTEPETNEAATSDTLSANAIEKTGISHAAPPSISEQTVEGEPEARVEESIQKDSGFDVKQDPVLKHSSAREKSEPHHATPLKERVDSIQALNAEQSALPAKDIWMEGLKEVIESDLHIRQRAVEPELELEGAERTSRSRRLAVWLVGLVVLLLVAAGGYWFYSSRLTPEVPAVETTEPSAAITENPATTPTSPTNAKPLLPPTPSQTIDPAVQVADVRVWLDNWAAAMRTRDANAQAAFYADTVDEYVGKYGVSKDTVLKDREATIHMRKGLWTVKMEKVVIDRRTKSQADVRLIKHFIDETGPSEIQESFVPTRLTLRRIDGSWKITSERDLPASPSPPAPR